MDRKSAVERWKQRHLQLLSDTYDQAWQQGVQNYEPPDRPNDPQDPRDVLPIPASTTVAALTFAQRQRRPYVPPTVPSEELKRAALLPATRSVESMARDMLSLTATAGHLDQAQAAVDAGTIPATGLHDLAGALAIADYIDTNGYRVNGGDSVAWAGEQAGFAEAADTAGQLLEWVTEESDVCADCEDLGGLPPMPLADWPTQPGFGQTECVTGCRCSFDAVDGDDLPDLTAQDSTVIDRLAANSTP